MQHYAYSQANVQFQSASVTTTENTTAVTVTYSVLNASSSLSFSFDIVVASTLNQTQGTDFLFNTISQTVPPGFSGNISFQVPIIDDEVRNTLTQSVTFGFANLVNGTVGAIASSTVTINDNDTYHGTAMPDVFISEIGWTANTSDAKYIELIVYRDGADLRDFTVGRFHNAAGNGNPAGQLRFANVPFWANLRSGTIIVINNNGTSPAPDPTLADGTVEVGGADPAYFSSSPINALDFRLCPCNCLCAAGGDYGELRNASGNLVHGIGYTQTAPTPAPTAIDGWGVGRTVVRSIHIRQFQGAHVVGSIGNAIMGTGAFGSFNWDPQTKGSAHASARIGINLPLRTPFMGRQTVASSFAAGNTSFSWTAAPDFNPADGTTGYLIVRSNTFAFTAPTQGQTYAVGSPLGAGTVVGVVNHFAGMGSSFNFTDATGTSTGCNFYRVYAFRFSGNNTTQPERARVYNISQFVDVMPANAPRATLLGGGQTLCSPGLAQIPIFIEGGTAPFTVNYTVNGAPASAVVASTGLTTIPVTVSTLPTTINLTGITGSPCPLHLSLTLPGLVVSTTYTVNPVSMVTWTGAVSADWFNNLNWFPNCAPNCVRGALIPPSTPNSCIVDISSPLNPVAGANAQAREIIVQDNATLALAATNGRLTICGTSTISIVAGSVLLGPNSEFITLNNSQLQVAFGTSSTNGRVLAPAGQSTVRINGQLVVNSAAASAPFGGVMNLGNNSYLRVDQTTTIGGATSAAMLAGPQLILGNNCTADLQNVSMGSSLVANPNSHRFTIGNNSTVNMANVNLSGGSVIGAPGAVFETGTNCNLAASSTITLNGATGGDATTQGSRFLMGNGSTLTQTACATCEIGLYGFSVLGEGPLFQSGNNSTINTNVDIVLSQNTATTSWASAGEFRLGSGSVLNSTSTSNNPLSPSEAALSLVNASGAGVAPRFIMESGSQATFNGLTHVRRGSLDVGGNAVLNLNGSLRFEATALTTFAIPSLVNFGGVSSIQYDDLRATGAEASFHNVRMNRGAVSAFLSIGSVSPTRMVVQNQLDLVQGVIQTNTVNGSEVVVENTASNAVLWDADPANSWVLGFLRRRVNSLSGTYEFPVGMSTDRQRFTVTFTNTPAGVFELRSRFQTTVPTGLPSFPTAVAECGASPYDLKMSYAGLATNAGFWSIEAFNAAGLQQPFGGVTYNAIGHNRSIVTPGQAWTLVKRPSSTGTFVFDGTCVASSTAMATQRNGLNGFSDFAAILQTTTPFPVEWLAFEAEYQPAKHVVNLDWATGSEHNARHFEVERSLDGTQFATLGSVDATGNSSTANAYAYVDNLLPEAASVLLQAFYIIACDKWMWMALRIFPKCGK